MWHREATVTGMPLRVMPFSRHFIALSREEDRAKCYRNSFLTDVPFSRSVTVWVSILIEKILLAG